MNAIQLKNNPHLNRYPGPVGTMVSLLAVLSSQTLYALPQDSKEPLFVRADSVDLNQKQHLGTYVGKVAVDQGSTHIRAAKAVTIGDDHNRLIKAVIEGDALTQAHYWTLQKPNKPVMHAYADILFYSPKDHQIKLIGHASVIQDHNKISASQLDYNLTTQQLITTFQGAQTIISIQSNDKTNLERP